MKKYKINFTDAELKNALHANNAKAKELLRSPDKWARFKKKLYAFIQKARQLPVIGELVDDIVCMVQMVDSYIKKEYTDVPVTSIIAAAAALIYILSPVDLIPDAIPVIGYVDDYAVITSVLKFGLGHDLEKYRLWRKQHQKDAADDEADSV